MQSWMGSEDMEPTEENSADLNVVPRLLRYAILLAKEGAKFRDSEGKTVSDYFS